MTNQQLALLLFEIHGKFDAILFEIKQDLPQEFRKTIKTFFGTEHTTIPILSNLECAVNDLNEQAKLLLTTGETP